jgi:hypothetical protein
MVMSQVRQCYQDPHQPDGLEIQVQAFDLPAEVRSRSEIRGPESHDLQHHAITELAESQASDRTVMAIAGHVSQRMLAHYSHVRIEATRRALDALAVGVKKQGYDTRDDTKPERASE